METISPFLPKYEAKKIMLGIDEFDFSMMNGSLALNPSNQKIRGLAQFELSTSQSRIYQKQFFHYNQSFRAG